MAKLNKCSDCDHFGSDSNRDIYWYICTHDKHDPGKQPCVDADGPIPESCPLKSPVKCCGKEPFVLLPCNESGEDCCRECVEKIECTICGRVIYQSDEEGVKDWNQGKDDG